MDQDLLISLSIWGNLISKLQGISKIPCKELIQPSYEYKVENGSTWRLNQDKGL